mmetsp:Transcript_72437/g.193122  ORF Transcript_72437/g.193122 Transcript_72437/m.193122 type:complete len:255 (-) Transcript_72437:156-920(-)
MIALFHLLPQGDNTSPGMQHDVKQAMRNTPRNALHMMCLAPDKAAGSIVADDHEFGLLPGLQYDQLPGGTRVISQPLHDICGSLGRILASPIAFQNRCNPLAICSRLSPPQGEDQAFSGGPVRLHHPRHSLTKRLVVLHPAVHKLVPQRPVLSLSQCKNKSPETASHNVPERGVHPPSNHAARNILGRCLGRLVSNRDCPLKLFVVQPGSDNLLLQGKVLQLCRMHIRRPLCVFGRCAWTAIGQRKIRIVAWLR